MADPTEDTLARSQRFRALFDDPTFRELKAETMGEIFREWVQTEPFDREGRERMYQTVLAIRSLEARLATESGPAEKREAEEREQRRLEAEERERRIAEEQRGHVG